jgi:hypothetical protein
MSVFKAETIKKRVITLTIMIHLREQYWAGEVPEGAERFEVSIQDDGIPCYTYWYKDNIDPTVICLPPGTWEIVCTSKTFKAWHALEVLEWFEFAAKCGFRDYSQPDDLRYPFEDHRQSLNSLLTSKGCDLNKIYLILKKK